MLQQTRAAVATPYYERFVQRFPDVHALARAPEDRVLAAWSGLGYYRRARHLHAAARIVVREHAGRIPSDAHAFAALPGVGRYTLGAVLSMGFGTALPVLDGNVARVLTRVMAQPLSYRRHTDAARLWAMAAAWLPPARGGGATDPGEWNQALMELGATLCTPRAPRCSECPVRRHCRALALGTPEAFPPPAARRAREPVRRAIALIESGGRTLVVRREGSLLAGLWEPPGVELGGRESAAPALRRRLAALGIRARLRDSGRRIAHTITHRAITVELWLATPARTPGRSALWRRARAGDRSLALTALARRALAPA